MAKWVGVEGFYGRDVSVKVSYFLDAESHREISSRAIMQTPRRRLKNPWKSCEYYLAHEYLLVAFIKKGSCA
jgi:hypothetical protein